MAISRVKLQYGDAKMLEVYWLGSVAIHQLAANADYVEVEVARSLSPSASREAKDAWYGRCSYASARTMIF